MTRTRMRRWGWRDSITCAVVAICGAGEAARAAAPVYALDGATTYCWELSMDALASTLSPQKVVSVGSGASCPLAVTLVATNASVHVGDAVELTWTVASSKASDSSAPVVGSSVSVIDTNPFVITHSAIHACARRNASAPGEASEPCDPFSAKFQSANVSAMQHASVSSLSRNGSFTFHSSGEVAFTTPGEYTLAAYIVVPTSNKKQRHDFVVYTAVSVFMDASVVSATSPDTDTNSNSSTRVSGDSTNTESTAEKKSELPFGMSIGQFIMMCTLAVLVLGCTVAVLVLSVRRKISARKKDKERAKESHTAAPSPLTGESEQFRISDWTEIYATQDALPSSILLDDSNTIAILRASRVSSPTYSAYVERKIADFTRDVGYWDVRPSASPITPLSSFFFPPSSSLHEDDVDSALVSPTDGFVSLETLGRRRTRPCYANALDDRGLADDGDGDSNGGGNSTGSGDSGGGRRGHSEVDDDEQEVDF